ncbi:hypothetical protein [Leptodesmis sp.]|uniref:hypothetical protein n=1 Tax=Leptodesmis sp. TaxID=3100501 RepID=UPI004053492B
MTARTRQQLPSGIEMWFSLPQNSLPTSYHPTYYKKSHSGCPGRLSFNFALQCPAGATDSNVASATRLVHFLHIRVGPVDLSRHALVDQAVKFLALSR